MHLDKAQLRHTAPPAAFCRGDCSLSSSGTGFIWWWNCRWHSSLERTLQACFWLAGNYSTTFSVHFLGLVLGGCSWHQVFFFLDFFNNGQQVSVIIEIEVIQDIKISDFLCRFADCCSDRRLDRMRVSSSLLLWWSNIWHFFLVGCLQCISSGKFHTCGLSQSWCGELQRRHHPGWLQLMLKCKSCSGQLYLLTFFMTALRECLYPLLGHQTRYHLEDWLTFAFRNCQRSSLFGFSFVMHVLKILTGSLSRCPLIWHEKTIKCWISEGTFDIFCILSPGIS